MGCATHRDIRPCSLRRRGSNRSLEAVRYQVGKGFLVLSINTLNIHRGTSIRPVPKVCGRSWSRAIDSRYTCDDSSAAIRPRLKDVGDKGRVTHTQPQPHSFTHRLMHHIAGHAHTDKHTHTESQPDSFTASCTTDTHHTHKTDKQRHRYMFIQYLKIHRYPQMHILRYIHSHMSSPTELRTCTYVHTHTHTVQASKCFPRN